MKDFKTVITASLISALILFSSISISCSGSTHAYTPSGLLSLLAFSSDRDQTVHVYTIKPDGTDNMSTSDDPQTLEGLPMWTPDGSKILFTTNESDDNEIWSMSADGSGRKQLSNRKEWDGLARMSPDGSKIVFAGEHTDPNGHKSINIYVMNSDGSDIKQLTASHEEESGAVESGNSHDENMPWNSVPTWSPDSSKILFATNREGDGVVPILYTMNPDGSDQKRFGFIFSIEGTEPDWSPVTNKIVFVKGSQAKGDIWVMDAGSLFPGLTAKKLTDNVDNNHSPVWSPDGTQIAFVSDQYGYDNIFIMNADGTNVRRVTYEKSNDRHPTWR